VTRLASGTWMSICSRSSEVTKTAWTNGLASHFEIGRAGSGTIGSLRKEKKKTSF